MVASTLVAEIVRASQDPAVVREGILLLWSLGDADANKVVWGLIERWTVRSLSHDFFANSGLWCW